MSLPRWCTRSMLRKSMVDSLISVCMQHPAMEQRVRPLEPYMHACRTDGLPSLACRWWSDHALVSRKGFLRARTTWAYGGSSLRAEGFYLVLGPRACWWGMPENNRPGRPEGSLAIGRGSMCDIECGPAERERQ